MLVHSRPQRIPIRSFIRFYDFPGVLFSRARRNLDARSSVSWLAPFFFANSPASSISKYSRIRNGDPLYVRRNTYPKCLMIEIRMIGIPEGRDRLIIVCISTRSARYSFGTGKTVFHNPIFRLFEASFELFFDFSRFETDLSRLFMRSYRHV
jgi:hypothetical protein